MVARVEIRPSGEHSAISCGELHGLSAHLVLRHADIGEAHARGLFAGDAAAGVENQFRIVLADQFGQRRRQPEARMEAELGEVRGKARFGAGDAEIRRHRKSKPAADGGAMHGGDDRLLVAEDAHGLDVEMVDRQVRRRIGLGALFLLLPRRIAEIGAGAERLALGGEHRGADFDVAGRILPARRRSG